MKPSDPSVVVEQTIDVPIENAWDALTTVSEMQIWFFFELRSFEPSIGFETEFEVEHESRTYLHQWNVVEAVSPSRLVLDWQYEHCQGKGLVEFDLSTEEDGSKIKVTNSIVEAFPSDDPAFTRESCEGGWTFLMNRLKGHAESSAAR